MSAYFISLKSMLDEYDVLNLVPTCSCGVVCTCEALLKVKDKKINTEYVIRFLKGLNEQYSGVRSQLMLMPPLPSLSKVFSLVIQQERQFNSIFGAANPGVIASVTQGIGRSQAPRSGSGGKLKGPKKLCSHCGKSGHTIDTCYRKHGFLLRFKFRNLS